MDKDDLRQAHQIGGIKTQNKFMRDDIKKMKKEIMLVTAIIIVIGLAFILSLGK